MNSLHFQSLLFIRITVLNCPRGFQSDNDRCECEKRLRNYTTACDVSTDSVTRKEHVWLRYDEDYLKVHTDCPLDYCDVASKVISLAHPDQQCANHHSGVIWWCLSGQLQHCTGEFQMLTVHHQLCIHLVNTLVCSGRNSLSDSPPSFQYYYFSWNTKRTHILCQHCFLQWNNQPSELFFASNTLSVHSMGQPGLWNRDMLLLWSGHLPKDMASICLPSLISGYW